MIISAQKFRDHTAKAERNLKGTSSDGISKSAAAFGTSVGAQMQLKPKSGFGNLLIKNAHKCSELDLHVSFIRLVFYK